MIALALTSARVAFLIGARAYGRADAFVIIASKGTTVDKAFHIAYERVEGWEGEGDLPDAHESFYCKVEAFGTRHVG